MKPIVAVVGRPNVGKSTLVNRLAQTSDAIVHESRGVTRDRSYHTADWNGREFTIVDTGGIEPLKSDDVFATSIRDQALAAAEEAAVILFVVDGRTGVTEEDESVARMLKRCDKPVFLLGRLWPLRFRIHNDGAARGSRTRRTTAATHPPARRGNRRSSPHNP